MQKILITGANGLIGSEVVAHFASQGHEVHGVDNNMRADFFGPQGDTRWNQNRLLTRFKQYRHHEIDLRNRSHVLEIVETLKPAVVVHCAAQPSHDLAAS